ncbi:hypothetical protein QUA82_19145 [Microcoleus sp. F8-D3]
MSKTASISAKLAPDFLRLVFHWSSKSADFGKSASAGETLLLSLVVLGLLINIDRTQSLARKHGFDITVSRWQYG